MGKNLYRSESLVPRLPARAQPTPVYLFPVSRADAWYSLILSTPRAPIASSNLILGAPPGLVSVFRATVSRSRVTPIYHAQARPVLTQYSGYTGPPLSPVRDSPILMEFRKKYNKSTTLPPRPVVRRHPTMNTVLPWLALRTLWTYVPGCGVSQPHGQRRPADG